MPNISYAYDRVLFNTLPNPRSHPAYLATAAHHVGLQTRPLDDCKVLEIGCGSGNNLLPMASAYSSSRFVGVDLSIRQVEAGRQIQQRAGITNVELLHGDIADWPPGLGTFDYIICNGVYSWIKPQLQTTLLGICKTHLATAGVACLSYNIYPGWHVKQIYRDAILFGSQPHAEPNDQVQHGLALLDFMANAPRRDHTRNPYLEAAFNELKGQDLSSIFHEYLAQDNHPCLFVDFVKRASAAGLQYVGSPVYCSMFGCDLPESKEKLLNDLFSDPIQREQCLDFIRNSQYRFSVLCDAEVKLSDDRVRAELKGYYFTAPGKSDKRKRRHKEPKCDTHPDQSREADGVDPTVEKIVNALAATRPAALQLHTIVQRVVDGARRGSRKGPTAEKVAEILLHCYQSGFVRAHLWPPPCSREIPERPCATPFARYEARVGDSATCLLHGPHRLEPAVRHVLMRLDGTRTREDLVAELLPLARTGDIELQPGRKQAGGRKLLDKVLQSNKVSRALLTRVVDNCLQTLALDGFLMARGTPANALSPLSASLASLTPGVIDSNIDMSRLERVVTEYVPDQAYQGYFTLPAGREQYRLLAYLSTLVNGAVIVDVGTLYGSSALALSYTPHNRVVSYDIRRSHHFPDKWGAIEFIEGNILETGSTQDHFKEIIGMTSLVVIDIDPHDGLQERMCLELLKRLCYRGWVLFDDIHLNPAMETFWSDVSIPKLDLTACGHWSGTGCVFFGGSDC